MPNTTIVYCADAIVLLEKGKIAVIERLTSPVCGLALPGGKREPGETLSMAAQREVCEETGYRFTERGVLGTFADPCRDPRGVFVTTVLYGTGRGRARDEPGKTCIHLMNADEIMRCRNDFVLDHFSILEQYLSLMWKHVPHQ